MTRTSMSLGVSNSRYLYELTQTEHSRFIEMTENYRSLRHIVDTANDFARNIRQRIKSTLSSP